jgi:hypothetical protein
VSGDQAGPVLLGGIAGTGKTRLGALLGRHSRLSVTRKTYLWREVYARFGDLRRPGNLDRCVTAALAIPGVRALQLDPVEVTRRVADRPPTYANVFDVIHGLHAEVSGKARWCDQLGLVEAYAEPVFASFPSARFIHMVGDPRHAQPTGRTPGVSGWAVGKWLTSVELADRNASRYGDRYLVLRHEDLLADEAAALRRVCDFLDEQVEPSMLTTASPTPPIGAHGHDRFIEAAAGSVMADQGYRPEPRTGSRSWPSDLIEWPANRLALTAWRRLGTRAIAKQIGAGA